MSAILLQPVPARSRVGARSTGRLCEAMPRPDDETPCGGERIVDFALCMVVAAAVVGLLLLAL